MDNTAPTTRSWYVYRPKDGQGDNMRIYNTTNRDVPLVVSVKGKEYMLAIPEWEHQPDYKPQAGDRIFRLLTPGEREHIAHMAAKARWQKNGRVGFKRHKRDMHEELKKKLTVFLLEEPYAPDTTEQ
jgi:hypothetical protein